MKTIKEQVKQFHRDGFLVMPNVLSAEECDVLKEDLLIRYHQKKTNRGIMKRMFESSTANLELFWKEPVVTFAEQLISNTDLNDDAAGGLISANEVHVIHNNSFSILAGKEGLASSGWHQDDTPHITSLYGEPIKNARLNVMVVTCNYYLSDVLSLQNGPTQFIPGSHLFGQTCNNEKAEKYKDQFVEAVGRKGTAVLFNQQVWHRGMKNWSQQDRPITQISYAKRLVGHKYGTFINYQMPQSIVSSITDPRKRRLLGFLSGGAYG